MNKNLLILSGPSGVGKGTVCQRLRQALPDLIQPVSLTTRMQRPGEIHGEHYWFVKPCEFEAKREAGELLEWVEYNGCFYATETAQVRRALEAGHTLLLEIDTHGALTLKAQFPEEAYLMFLTPPSLAILRQRLETRGSNSPEDIERRLQHAHWELTQQGHFDLSLENQHLETTVAHLHAQIQLLMS
ncbi:MAG: guanylate kinase [Vampirovibrionales bacterium]|nr:guanylate kinase [Vampirovibrionales bacterium]